LLENEKVSAPIRKHQVSADSGTGRAPNHLLERTTEVNKRNEKKCGEKRQRKTNEDKPEVGEWVKGERIDHGRE
jgi:hypothetical protein